jgi:LPXTG-site transpeptidase (sortase) family protein
VAGLCPYLGLDGNPNDVHLVPTAKHRCYVRRKPERVGNEHQVAVCLTSSYRRCPRFLSVATRHERQMSQPPGQQKGISARHPGLRAAQTRPRTRARRGSLTLTEFMVGVLILGIVLSFAFVGYAAFYRVRVGPGLAAAPAVVQEEGAATLEPLPTWTPLPTRTPAALPSPAAEVAALPEPSATAESVNEPTAAASPTAQSPTPTTPARLPAASPPTRLVISAIDLDVPVGPVQVVEVGEGSSARAVWGALPDAAGFHYTSAYPGNPGNTVINGHRDIHAAVFRNLDQVEVGDSIVLYVGEVAYPYVTAEVLVVPETFASAKQRAKNLQLIGTMPEERLTLITCTPVGLATHRLLVIARPVAAGEPVALP